MAKIIRDTKQITEYYEDYRCGGYSTRTVEAYYCGKCKRELVSSSVKFCSHCGSALRGIQDEIEKRRKKKVKPYEIAYENILNFRNTFDKESLEYNYLTETLKEIRTTIVQI